MEDLITLLLIRLVEGAKDAFKRHGEMKIYLDLILVQELLKYLLPLRKKY